MVNIMCRFSCQYKCGLLTRLGHTVPGKRLFHRVTEARSPKTRLETDILKIIKNYIDLHIKIRGYEY